MRKSPNFSKDPLTRKECEQWLRNKKKKTIDVINPRTNRKIKRGGIIYQKIERQCQLLGFFDEEKYIGRGDKAVMIYLPDVISEEDYEYIMELYEKKKKSLFNSSND